MAHFLRLHAIISKVKLYFQNLNLFSTSEPTADHRELRTQIISTRFFLLSLSVSFIVLVVYTSAVTITKSIAVPSPTLTQYSQLYTDHSQSLTCPCTTISQTYHSFIDLDFTLHQICSSALISDSWINELMDTWRMAFVGGLDFRFTATFQFQALQSLCGLMNATINNGLSRFFAAEYVTLHVSPESLFTSQADSIINGFIANTIKDFARSFRIIRDSIQANGLLATSQSNAFLYVSQLESPPSTIWRMFGECSCIHSSQCHQQATIYNGVSDQVRYRVPGFKMGCYTVESLLQSSLECLYSATCFAELSYYTGLNGSSNATVMNGSMSSRFSETSSVDDLLDEMMVERWDRRVMYEKYYDGCGPKEP